MTTPKTILVTGCAGFIGSNFAKQFRKNFPKTKIIGVDDFSTGRKESLESSIIFYEGSILNENLLVEIFSKHKPEYVFHFAALPRVSYSVEHPRHTSEVNIVGTVALLEASKNHGVKRFVYSSSSSIYGGAKKLPTKESENLPDPKSPYAVQKYIGEPFCKIFSELFGLDTICLRYFNVFGPGQYGDSPYSTVVSAWLESIYFPKKKLAFIEGDGSQSRDFCYVDNIVSANILSMKSKRNFSGEALNIACGSQTKINEVKRLIEKYTGKKLDLEKRPPRLGDVKHTRADISKARKLIGYTASVDFESGLKETINLNRATYKNYSIMSKVMREKFPLKNLTTLKVGGPARWFLAVQNEKDLIGAINFTKKNKVKWCIIGDGSNLVPDDKGFDGLIIKNEIGGIRKVKNKISVGVGENLTKFIFKIEQFGLAGMEKMAGIPGTIGGAIYGCAGAYGQEIKDCLTKVKIFNGGKTLWLTKKQCQFGYRESIFKKKKDWIILEAEFKFREGNAKELQKISKEIIKMREKKYWPQLLCPGSFFKNVVVKEIKPISLRQKFLLKIPKDKIMFGKVPAGYFLEAVGAKGTSVGEIMIANHHGNLLYNKGGGTARDIKKLSKTLKTKVLKVFGIELQEEVQYL